MKSIFDTDEFGSIRKQMVGGCPRIWAKNCSAFRFFRHFNAESCPSFRHQRKIWMYEAHGMLSSLSLTVHCSNRGKNRGAMKYVVQIAMRTITNAACAPRDVYAIACCIGRGTGMYRTKLPHTHAHLVAFWYSQMRFQKHGPKRNLRQQIRTSQSRTVLKCR